MAHSSVEPKRQEAQTPLEPTNKRVPYHPSLREQWNREDAEQLARDYPGLTVEKALEMIEDLGF